MLSVDLSTPADDFFSANAYCPWPESIVYRSATRKSFGFQATSTKWTAPVSLTAKFTNYSTRMSVDDQDDAMENVTAVSAAHQLSYIGKVYAPMFSYIVSHY